MGGGGPSGRDGSPERVRLERQRSERPDAPSRAHRVQPQRGGSAAVCTGSVSNVRVIHHSYYKQSEDNQGLGLGSLNRNVPDDRRREVATRAQVGAIRRSQALPRAHTSREMASGADTPLRAAKCSFGRSARGLETRRECPFRPRGSPSSVELHAAPSDEDERSREACRRRLLRMAKRASRAPQHGRLVVVQVAGPPVTNRGVMAAKIRGEIEEFGPSTSTRDGPNTA